MLFDVFKRWLQEIENIAYYCLNKFNLSYYEERWRLEWVLSKCSAKDNYVHVGIGDAGDELILRSLINSDVLIDLMLCYSTDDGKFTCWVKEDQRRKRVGDILINKPEGLSNIIYLYHKEKENEYLLLLDAKGIVTKYVRSDRGDSIKLYSAIKDIVKAKGKYAIWAFLEGYERIGKDKISIVDIALEDLEIDDCVFYKKLLPFMIVSLPNEEDEKEAIRSNEVYDVHTLVDKYKYDKERKLDDLKSRIEKKLERCLV